jgi:formylglycine-generating enzyme required for sulfatase activity
VLTLDDCDDGDASKPNDDMDCDGVLTLDDCDDGDASTVYDMDCDGVLASDDCNDGDASTVYDMDCDGHDHEDFGGDDCDDGDASSTVVADDGDCDGVLTADDCDDGDAGLGAVADDGDCDGVLTAEDCDDGDAALGRELEDGDCHLEEYVADHGGTMIKIDAQTFEMGCTAGMSSCYSDESPAHDVTLTNDFYIGETEVTQGEYEAMMGTNPSHFVGCDDCPVEYVSWHMSAAFANAVSDSEGLEQCYTCTGSGTSANCSIVESYGCDGYRLPTEAEWEAAARCGEDTLYAGSTVIGDVAWYSHDSGSRTHMVANKASNACGLYDMSGNLWEWTQDRYSSSYYGSSPGTDPVGTGMCCSRVFRGGSWFFSPPDARVAVRGNHGSSFRSSSSGLRLLRTSP